VVDLIDQDFFADAALSAKPYPYFDHLRTIGPVSFEPHHGVAMVAGYKEALAVYNDASNFSACNATGGPMPPLPFVPEGDDISAQIAAHRGEMPSCDLVVTYDEPEHTRARSLLMRLFTPSRLKANEAYLTRLCEITIDELLQKGEVEVVTRLGNPYAALVIADLLGIPDEDRELYRDRLTGIVGAIGGGDRWGRRERQSAAPARVPARKFRGLYRAAPGCALRRCAERPGGHSISRRYAAASDRGGLGCGQPVRGGPGNDGPSAGDGASHHCRAA
jgi:cytochrome P450